MEKRPSDEDIKGNTERLNLFSDSPGISPYESIALGMFRSKMYKAQVEKNNAG
jgi:hypothetical protein